MTRPSHLLSCSFVRTSKAVTPGILLRQVQCSRNDPCSASTPTFVSAPVLMPDLGRSDQSLKPVELLLPPSTVAALPFCSSRSCGKRPAGPRANAAGRAAREAKNPSRGLPQMCWLFLSHWTRCGWVQQARGDPTNPTSGGQPASRGEVSGTDQPRRAKATTLPRKGRYAASCLKQALVESAAQATVAKALPIAAGICAFRPKLLSLVE